VFVFRFVVGTAFLFVRSLPSAGRLAASACPSFFLSSLGLAMLLLFVLPDCVLVALRPSKERYLFSVCVCTVRR